MAASTGQTLVAVEEQLQAVLAGLERFLRARDQFERGCAALDATAARATELVQQAEQCLSPALAAVAALRRLDPDRLLREVSAAALGVQDQLQDQARQRKQAVGVIHRYLLAVASLLLANSVLLVLAITR